MYKWRVWVDMTEAEKKKSMIFKPKVLFIDAAGVVWAAKEERDEVQLTTK